MSPDTQQMSAAVLYGKEQLRIERVEVPKLDRATCWCACARR